jgi:NADPH:quinone reductase-like Zn-dependent oxidoreductase
MGSDDVTMRAAVFHAHGGTDQLSVERRPRPEPAAGEVRIRVEAAGLNHLDLWTRRGLPFEIPLPHIGGSDIAGVVDAVGADADAELLGARVVVNPSLWCGRCRECVRGEQSLCGSFRVLGEHTDGGFAEFVTAPGGHVYPLPAEYPFVDAAALPISYGTAWRTVVGRAGVQPGEDVLVLGASGGTAVAAIQIALLAGARVFAVTSGAENVARVRALGVQTVYDRTRVDFAQELYRDTAKRGVDVVVENVGEATWRQSIRSLARNGRLVTYGATTGPRGEIDLRLLFWKQLRIIGSTMASKAEFEAMLRVAFQHRIRPVVDRVLPLEQIRSAHDVLEDGAAFGKVVLVP